MGGPERALLMFFKDKATGGLLLVILIAILVLEFGSLAVLFAERTSPDANITTAGDALWYTVVTMSTVGYGDQYPVTELGRLFGVVIIVVGVGVFGTLTGYLANIFLSPSDSHSDDVAATDELLMEPEAPVVSSPESPSVA
jgi:voltage-gated potassium channel